MACITIPTGAALLGSGALTAAGGIASSVIGSGAAQDASKIQAQSAKDSAQDLRNQETATAIRLNPFTVTGQNAALALGNLTGGPTGQGPLTTPFPALSPFNPTMDSLEQTPGYQFIKDQGLKATQNAFAGQGLGQSGAATKGAVNYAEGLASTTFQQQFQNYLQQQQQQFGQYLQGNQQTYNMLGGLSTVGENAGAGTGAQSISAASTAAQLATSGAAASAAGVVGSANALTGGIGAVTGAGQNYALLNALTNGGGLFGSTKAQVSASPTPDPGVPTDALSNSSQRILDS